MKCRTLNWSCVHMPPWTTLIESEELHSVLQAPSVVILDCRFSLQDVNAGRSEYETAHIPGAFYVDLDEDLSSPGEAGVSGRHPLPKIETLTAFLRRCGISQNSQVVAYDNSGGAFAARAWWILKWLGHESVAVLNGGWSAWNSAGFAIDAEQPQDLTGSFTPDIRSELLIDLDQIDSVVGTDSHILVDARAAARYRGEHEPIDPVAGHIPGAISAPFKDNLDESGKFKAPGELREQWASLLATEETNKNSVVVCYCGSGVTGAHDVLAMEYAGLNRPKLYVGSWSHWITDASREIEVG